MIRSRTLIAMGLGVLLLSKFAFSGDTGHLMLSGTVAPTSAMRWAGASFRVQSQGELGDLYLLSNGVGYELLLSSLNDGQTLDAFGAPVEYSIQVRSKGGGVSIRPRRQAKVAFSSIPRGSLPSSTRVPLAVKVEGSQSGAESARRPAGERSDTLVIILRAI